MINDPTTFDHTGEGTHEAEQAAQPELGAPAPPSGKLPKKAAKKRAPAAKKAKTKKATPAKKKAKGSAKKAKRPAKKTARKPAKKAKASKAKKSARKPVRKPAAKKAAGRGIRADGKPRRKPGTNPPKSEAARRYGAKVAKLRKLAGLTQKELAAKAGLSQPGLANIERGVSHGQRASGAALGKALRDKSLAPAKAA